MVFGLIFAYLIEQGLPSLVELIFQNSDSLARIVGIDHDGCLMFKQIEELRMDYLQLVMELRFRVNFENSIQLFRKFIQMMKKKYLLKPSSNSTLSICNDKDWQNKSDLEIPLEEKIRRILYANTEHTEQSPSDSKENL